MSKKYNIEFTYSCDSRNKEKSFLSTGHKFLRSLDPEHDKEVPRFHGSKYIPTSCLKDKNKSGDIKRKCAKNIANFYLYAIEHGNCKVKALFVQEEK